MFWVLDVDGKTPKPVTGTFQEAALKFAACLNEDIHRVVGVTRVGPELCVSTVFVGYDMNMFGLAMDLSIEEAPPLLFETAVFGGPARVQIGDRYSTWDEAERGHEAAVAETREAYERGMRG